MMETCHEAKPAEIIADITVDEIMRRWPATIQNLIGSRMLCIGWPIGIFHTANDASEAHDFDQHALCSELLEAMRGDRKANAPSALDNLGG